MKTPKPLMLALGSVLAVIAQFGCAKFSSQGDPPAGRAIVWEHRDDERDGGYDYWFAEIDGRAVERKNIFPFWTDQEPVVTLAPGTHVFKVHRVPHRRRPDTVPIEMTFTAPVESGASYFIGTGGELPVLIREYPRAAKPSGTQRENGHS